MIATPGAGGMGNTWVVADLVVYFSNNYDLEQRVQSEDRTHRIGQTRSVTYVDLVARGTVDEKILAALRAKINLSAQITGANWREWVV
jgi:SNF2 family DNA or RNA helicase